MKLIIIINHLQKELNEFIVKRAEGMIMVLEEKLKELDKEIWGNIKEEYIKNVTVIYGVVNLFTDPEKVSLNLTNEPSICFTSIYPNKRVYFEVFFEEDNSLDVSLTIIENGTPPFSFGGDWWKSLLTFGKKFNLKLEIN